MSRPEHGMNPGGNFRSLVIAGLGSIGRSLWRLGRSVFAGFDRVVGIDLDPPGWPEEADVLRGDLTDRLWTTRLLESLPKPALLVNLCGGVDNLAVRRGLSGLACGYLDSCAAAPDTFPEYRLGRLMPRTLSPVPGGYPHWVCWGINPGLVELVARRTMAEMDGKGPFAVTIFENDGLVLANDSPAGLKTAVGWSPEALVEEMMLSPVLEVRDGKIREGRSPGAPRALVRWGADLVPSRIVAHEDIWCLGQLPQVGQARFVYGLHPAVMDVFEGEPQRAAARLAVPSPETPIEGIERIAVRVRDLPTGESRTRLWRTDHAETWARFRVNAVQWQTAKSLLLAIRLLQETGYGLEAGVRNAAGLPVKDGWETIDRMLFELGIDWMPADDFEIELVA